MKTAARKIIACKQEGLGTRPAGPMMPTFFFFFGACMNTRLFCTLILQVNLAGALPGTSMTHSSQNWLWRGARLTNF